MRADRLLSLLVLLQSRRSMTAGEIARSLDISLRTVYRDMDALQRVGVPITATAGPNGGYSVVPGYRSVLAGFSSDEIGALMAAASAADFHALGMAEVLNTAILKLAAYRRDQGRVVAVDPERVLLDGTAWGDSDRSAVLGTVMEAIATQRVVALEMTAIPYGGTYLRLRVQPIGVVHKGTRWYLVYRTGAYRVVAMDDVRSVTTTDTRVAIDPVFNLKVFWTEWCKQVVRDKHRFSADLALQPDTADAARAHLAGASVHVLSRSTPPASIESTRGAEINVTATFSSFEEARALLLGLGRAVRIVHPDALRLSVLDFARQVQAANGETSGDRRRRVDPGDTP